MINMQPTASGNVPAVLNFLNSNGMIPDGIAIGPYYSMYYHASLYKAWAAWTTDMLVDAWVWDFYFNTSSGGGNSWGGAQTTLLSGYRSALDTWNAAHGAAVQLLIYEYAPEFPFPNFQSTISGAMDGATTTLTLSADVSSNPLDNNFNDALKVQPGTWLKVDSEWMTVTSRSGVTCTVVRGQGGTTAAAHSSGASVRNDWIEGIRDITLHPNYRIAHYDALAFFQSYGVYLCMPSALDQTWSGAHAWSDYHAIYQVPGKGDGSDGLANNLLCLARPGQTHTKAATVNQDLSTVSVRGQAMIDWTNSGSPRRKAKFVPRPRSRNSMAR
jgi:hypothetical protein